MTDRSIPSAWALAAMIALAMLTACASVPAPLQQVAEAEHAVQEAAAANAATLAPAELGKAQGKLDAARSALRAGDHVKARQLAEQAVVDGEMAQITARSEETARAAADLRAQLRTLGEPATQDMVGL
jgi:hypothetical protein